MEDNTDREHRLELTPGMTVEELLAAVEDNGHRLDIVRGGVTVARIERAAGAQRGIDRASLNEVAAGLRELSLRQTLGPNLDLRDLVDDGRE